MDGDALTLYVSFMFSNFTSLIPSTLHGILLHAHCKPVHDSHEACPTSHLKKMSICINMLGVCWLMVLLLNPAIHICTDLKKMQLHRFDPDPHFQIIAERDLMGHMRSTMDALRSGVFVDGMEVNWI